MAQIAQLNIEDAWFHCQSTGDTLGGHSGYKAREPKVGNSLRQESEKYFGTGWILEIMNLGELVFNLGIHRIISKLEIQITVIKMT